MIANKTGLNNGNKITSLSHVKRTCVKNKRYYSKYTEYMHHTQVAILDIQLWSQDSKLLVPREALIVAQNEVGTVKICIKLYSNTCK